MISLLITLLSYCSLAYSVYHLPPYYVYYSHCTVGSLIGLLKALHDSWYIISFMLPNNLDVIIFIGKFLHGNHYSLYIETC